MKQLKYKMPGLLLAILLLVIANEIDMIYVRYGLMAVAVIGVIVLAYLITKDITDYVYDLSSKKELEYDKRRSELKEVIEKCSDKQTENTKELVSVTKDFKASTDQYIEKVESLEKIQQSMIDEGEKLIEEVKTSNKDMIASIEGYMDDYEIVLNESKDSINALKAHVKVSLEKMSSAIEAQSSSVEDGFDDCVYEIKTQLKKFNKDQSNRDNEQNYQLNEEIKAIGEMISNKVGDALEANKQLLDYIQQVQTEWTTLSKDEIEFLDKVWNEK